MSPGPTAFPATNQTPFGPTLKAFINSVTAATNVISVGGATGLGVADDTAAIHAARDAAGANGQLFFPPGTYKTAGLTASVAGQTWILAPGATLLGTGASHVVSATANGVTIQGPGKIDIGAASAYSGVFFNAGLADGSVLGVEIVNGTYGVRCKGATGAVTTRLRVSRCAIHGTSSHGVFFNWETTDSEISDNQIYSVGGNGIWVGNSSLRTKITNNTITSSGRIGIENFGGSHGATIIGNVVTTCTTIGISLDTSDNSRVAFNRVESPALYGLECAASNNCVYHGNVVITPGDNGISISALSVGTSCDDNTISNNIILNPTGNGIYAGGSSQGAKRLRVLGNYVRDPGNGASAVIGIGCVNLIGGADWLIANNTIRWTISATSSTAINVNTPNTTVEANHIIHDAGLAVSGGTAISLNAAALDCNVGTNTIEGNGKCVSGIVLNAACTGCLVTDNKITGTTSNLINNNSASATNHFAGNLCTRTSGGGITYGGGTWSGNRDTANAFQVIAGGVKIGNASTETVGFYGATPVAQATAPAAPPALAAVPVGGTGTAAGGWDTAAHRDSAITAMNALIATVRDHDAKLRTLGLWA